VNFPEHPVTTEITTLMIRNVPRRYTEDAIVYEINKMVGPVDYNFLYLPWDTRRSSNMGFAFVNFVSAEIAENVSQKHNGAPWSLITTKRGIAMMPAHLQGLANNLAHYMGAVVAKEGHMHAPRVLVNGVSIPFQEALRRFCHREIPQESGLISSDCVQAEHGFRCINLGGSAKYSESMPGDSSSSTGNSFLDKESEDTFDSHTDHGTAEIAQLREHCEDFATIGYGGILQSNSLTTHQSKQMIVHANLHLRSDQLQHPSESSEVQRSREYREAWTKTTQQLEKLCSAGVFQASQ